MKTNTAPMHPERYYHIYNRGINGEQLFKQERNYTYFLAQYAKYIEPIATTYAYVLMGNHFHFLLKTRTEVEICENLRRTTTTFGEVQNLPEGMSANDNNLSDGKKEKTIEQLINHQFAKLFNSYAQAINKQEKRTGALFEESFRRKVVDSEAYAAQMVYYIHYNSKKHKFVDDFKTYPYSSYRAFLQTNFTRLPREEVFDWFGGKSTFLAYHGEQQDFAEDWADTNWIEFD